MRGVTEATEAILCGATGCEGEVVPYCFFPAGTGCSRSSTLPLSFFSSQSTSVSFPDRFDTFAMNTTRRMRVTTRRMATNSMLDPFHRWNEGGSADGGI